VFRFPRQIAVLFSLLLLTLAGCSSSSGSKTAVAPSSSKAASAASSSSTAVAGAAQIVIDNFTFSPATLTVTPGEKVTVVNKDSTTHTVTATGNKAFDTGDIASGATTTFTAPSTAGSYPYICTIHQFMHGTLTVS
jgi:plastocyanin